MLVHINPRKYFLVISNNYLQFSDLLFLDLNSLNYQLSNSPKYIAKLWKVPLLHWRIGFYLLYQSQSQNSPTGRNQVK
jgi:hypothetical protein